MDHLWLLSSATSPALPCLAFRWVSTSVSPTLCTLSWQILGNSFVKCDISTKTTFWGQFSLRVREMVQLVNACCQAWKAEFEPQDPCARWKELTTTSCSQASNTCFMGHGMFMEIIEQCLLSFLVMISKMVQFLLAFWLTVWGPGIP